ncbi:DUF3025 domain-containing protein [Pseudoalteromonas ardens]|uniref:Transmembrane protein n=1 Tax=Pseudoalteromonas rubra TaxID=43658 RepID=A0A0L0ET20_9GAMM|nr:DUF3025 domain-containing protein [Pseudoalteromonas sp. R96]KNC67525.1 transmembrane protein [Pseudoalteromonas rubra]MDK1310891.1 DUF3025 domain-containing protein [Pseudoalteromonas sp. R96]
MNKFTAPEHWHADLFNQAPFEHLEELFALSHHSDWPSFTWLNEQKDSTQSRDIVFTPNSELESETLYYEEIIAHTHRIPTRENNWHDFFGALIWCLFPQTKSLLNRLHMQEIAEHGLKQRSKKRNALTLFDECGVVLAIPDLSWQSALRAHQWQEIFYEYGAMWHHNLLPFTFGHANYEMLTKPFIGLTGKVVCVEVDEAFYHLPLQLQYRHLDQKLVNMIEHQGLLDNNQQMSPLPLLGIPQWYQGQQDLAFYSDTDYFRPKRQPIKKKDTQ